VLSQFCPKLGRPCKRLKRLQGAQAQQTDLACASVSTKITVPTATPNYPNAPLSDYTICATGSTDGVIIQVNLPVKQSEVPTI